jgi:hypothetical protein
MWIILIGVSVCWLVWYANRWLDIDRCLDLGGSWNYETSTCKGLPSIDESGRVIQK